VQLFSSLKNTGMEEAEAAIGTWLATEEKESPAKGDKAGDSNTSVSTEVPAQGGKAGDDSSPSVGYDR
jgi:hypothetical protein